MENIEIKTNTRIKRTCNNEHLFVKYEKLTNDIKDLNDKKKDLTKQLSLLIDDLKEHR